MKSFPIRDPRLRKAQTEPSSTRWLVVALTFLLLIIAAGFFQWTKLREARYWVLHARQVILDIERLLGDIHAAEAAQRGYLLSKRPQYLAPYQTARQAAFDGTERLEELVAGNQAQEVRMRRLRAVLSQKISEQDRAVDLELTQDREAVGRLLKDDRGPVLMQEIERILGAIRRSESKALERQIGQEQATAAAAVGILFIGGFILLVLLVAASIRINAQIVRQRTLLADAAGQMEELVRSNEELQRFAFVTSHDLQEPLRIISSYSTLLAKRYAGKLDAQGDEFLHFISTHVERMQELIRDLLEYSRAGKRGEHMTQIPLDSVLQHALDNLEVSITESRAEVTRDPLPELTANPAQLIPIFQNLIGNAIKFRGGQPPRIHVSAKQEDGFWLFSVTDNGIGIEPQYLERIFGLFQRLEGKSPGTGIGLAICKKTVESYGGKIWAESTAGKGSSFHFTLPA